MRVRLAWVIVSAWLNAVDSTLCTFALDNDVALLAGCGPFLEVSRDEMCAVCTSSCP
jgi:hypothetical protein